MVVTHQVGAFFFKNGRRAQSPAFLKNGHRALALDISKNLRLFDLNVIGCACSYSRCFDLDFFKFIFLILRTIVPNDVCIF